MAQGISNSSIYTTTNNCNRTIGIYTVQINKFNRNSNYHNNNTFGFILENNIPFTYNK